MNGSLGIGVVGAGSISLRGLLPHLTQPDVQDRVRVTAVCDAVPGRAQAAAEKFGVPRGYDSYEELLADPSVDAVTIASPIGIHFEQGMQAVKAGKHIHFNKTMTTTVDEVERVIDAAREKGVKLVASPGQMLNPLNRRIREIVQGGDLGKLAWAATGCASGDALGGYHERERMRTGNDVLTNVDPSWYYRKPGGGPLYDMTVYGLHTMTGILGPAKRVTAFSGVALKEREFQGKTVRCDADDNTLMVLDFGDALYTFVYGTFAGALLPFAAQAIFGTKGAIIGNQWNGKAIEMDEWEGARLPHVVGPHREIEESHVFEDVMQLVDWVREGIPAVPTAEHARHVIDIIEASYRSSETGQAQDLHTTF